MDSGLSLHWITEDIAASDCFQATAFETFWLERKPTSHFISNYLREGTITVCLSFHTNYFLIIQQVETPLQKKGGGAGMRIISFNSMQNVPIYRQFLTLQQKCRPQNFIFTLGVN